MQKYEFLLFDLDDTLFDFSISQYNGMHYIMKKYGLEFTEDRYQHYLDINHQYWSMLEHKQIDANSLRSRRFEDFFSLYGITVDGKAVDEDYRHYLDNSCHLLPHALDLLKNLYVNYKLYAVTNGIEQTQLSRLDECNIKNFFDDVFISEAIGYNKPQVEFFNIVEERIPGFNKAQALIIGDSLTSDIQGGTNFGIDTCWFNPNHIENTEDLNPTYEIENYDELLSILNV